MSFRPVVACTGLPKDEVVYPSVACTGLSKDEVVYPEMLVKGARADDVHCPWLEVHQDGTWHIASSNCFVEVDIDALKLRVRISVVADYLPKLGSKMIPALTALDVDKTQSTNMRLLSLGL